MPSIGLSGPLLLVIILGAGIALPAIWLIWKELSGQEALIGRYFWPICLCLGVTVLMMGSGRHFYRDTALASHQSQMKKHTAEYLRKTTETQAEATLLAKDMQAQPLDQRGAQIFQQSCSGCHGPKQRIVGPPVTEMKEIYAKNPDGLVAWIKAPGKKRKDYPQMPAFGNLSSAELEALKSFVLK
jgi:cytochrome c